MSAPLEILIGTDVTRLYRMFRAAGVEFGRMRLRLDSDALVMWRTGFRMLGCGIEQLVPQAQLVHSGNIRVDYRIETPALSWVENYYQDIHPYVREHSLRYLRDPVTIRICQFAHLQCMDVRLYRRDPDPDWYGDGYSLCALWQDLRAIFTEILRLEAHQRAIEEERGAGIAGPRQE